MKEKLSKVLFLSIFVLIVNSAEDDNCRFNEYNFRSLEKFPWNVVIYNGSNRVEYLISLCQPLNSSVPECSRNTSVCQLSDLKNISLGVHNASFQMSEDVARRELTLALESQDYCPDKGIDRKMRTFIIFKCGKTLGMPVFVSSYACDTYFEWYTTVACKSSPRVNEIKCYLYDTNGQLRDLGPLVKTSGSYQVETDDDSNDGEMYINICRDISQTSGCQNSSACFLKNSSSILVGSVDSDARLLFDRDGNLFLTYKSTAAAAPVGCSSAPSTKVTLRCPRRGMGDMPRLISSHECQYHVEWATEYACPVVELVSHTCELHQPANNLAIDLRSLGTGQVVSIQVQESGLPKYNYSLNICSQNLTVGSGVACGQGRTAAACQSDVSGSVRSLGLLEKQTLRYSDHQLSLTYEGGDPCSSGFQRKTIINFHCNESAGRGFVDFFGEDRCTYMFEWSTDLACVASPPPICHLSANGAKYDLSRLIRISGFNNWRATDTETSETIILNVCESLSTSDRTAIGCPAGAAICLLKNGSTSLSLGKFQISPVFDGRTQSISLSYTGGDTCGTHGSKYSANITFKCSPGTVENEPTLLQKTSDGCHYELVWFTASACSLAHLSGDNCRVEDSLAGYSFDLNPLSKPANVPGSYYNVTNEQTEHAYFLNVCGPVTGTVCSGETVGICQVDKNNQRNYHNAGQANRTLHYYNGVLKLVYEKGDAYRRDPPVARKTEIEFLCDAEAGIGMPRFESEANFTYSIEWMTSYACPPMFVDCSFVDLKTKNRYDLSPLARKDADGNWVLEIKTGIGSGRKLYINVCRPVVALNLPGSDACTASAGVCQTEYSGNQQEKVKVANYGRSLTGPRLSSDGKIILEYTNGDICYQNNATLRYSTRIVFICNKDITTLGPSTNEFNTGCNQTLIWETAFACPEDSSSVTATGDQCSIRDPITGHLYDLRPLHAADKSYTVNNTGRVFKLNICGPAADCGRDAVSVCDDGGTHFGFSFNSSISFSNGLVELLYYGPDTENGRRKVTLTFTCNDLLQENSPRITFVEEEGTVLLFDVETPLACLSFAINCQTFDGMGNRYDLTPLMRLNDNWIVEDQRRNRYFINICRPINSVNSTSACPGGAVGGCQVTSSGDVFNMGYVQGHLIAPELNSVTMQYQNGDICHNGTDRESRRSTRITFYCSGRHESPIFVREEDDCSYVFDWLTPFACPIQHVIGENCTVKDPLYQVTFDLKGLTKAGDDDYVVYDDSRRNFTLNVCGALRSHRNDSCAVNAGACMGQGNSAINLGNYTSRLEYEDGELKLFYSDGKESCNGRWNRTATVMFSCDHSKRGASGLLYLDEKSSDCSHWFEWQTSAACLPFSQAECSIADDKGNVFNFERLTMSDDNYEIDGSDAPDGPAKFIINVCTTLVHTKGALCPPNSAACMIKVNETDPRKRYVSIGRLNGTVLGFENSHLVLSYDGGAECSTQQKAKTVIQFQCAQAASVGRPEYVTTDAAACVHRFVWSTRAACVQNTTAAASSGDCSVQDPNTGHIYNLSALRNDEEPYVVSSSQFDHSYSLNVCGPLHNSSCGNNSGSCQIERLGEKRPFNAGQSNSFLLYESSGLLKLIYSNGTMCRHAAKRRMTSITFICSTGTGKGKPQFIGENPDDCSYFFSWHTDLACDREIRCVAHSDEYEQDFDLSQLSTENAEYSAPGNATGSSSGAFFLSVCRPLSPMYKKRCPPGAAVCREETEGQYVSLGSFNSGPVYDPVTKSVVLVYSNGKICRGESSLLWKTKISFFCRPGQPENLPKLVRVDENLCEYEFEWITSAVCPSAPSFPVTNITDCIVKDTSSQNQYNFSALMSSSGSYIQAPSRVHPGHKYNISLCGAFPSGVCALSAVCLVNDTSQVTAYGNSRSLMTVLELPDVKLSYRYGVRCLNGYSSAVFLMECDQLAARDSKPFALTEEECFVMFKWLTPFACLPKVKPCKFHYDSNRVIDLSRYSLKTGSWKLTDASGDRYLLNLCHGINDGPSGCGSDMAVCQVNADGSLRLLGSVDSQSYAKSSGAENSLTIEYSHAFNKISCRTRIEIVCGLENEEPQLKKQSVDDCSVEFEWKMNLMCEATGSLTLTPVTGSPKTPFDSSNSGRQERGNASSQTVVITISVLASVVLLLLLILAFRNPSRRAAFIGKVKSCFGRKRSLSSLQYTALSDRDLNEGDGLLNRNNGNIQHYDSDDDLML